MGGCQGRQQWSVIGAVASGCLCHDGSMSKRSTRLAKRVEFENAIKAVEERIRARRGKGADLASPGETGRAEGQHGESGGVEIDKQEEGK